MASRALPTARKFAFEMSAFLLHSTSFPPSPLLTQCRLKLKVIKYFTCDLVISDFPFSLI